MSVLSLFMKVSFSPGFAGNSPSRAHNFIDFLLSISDFFEIIPLLFINKNILVINKYFFFINKNILVINKYFLFINKNILVINKMFLVINKNILVINKYFLFINKNIFFI